MEQQEEIQVSEASGPQPIDQSTEEPPQLAAAEADEAGIPQSTEGDGGALEVGLGATGTDDSLPPPACAREADEPPVLDPAAAAAERVGDAASDVDRPQSLETSNQEDLFPSAGEEGFVPQREEGEGEAQEMDEKKAHAFEPDITASAGAVDETLEGEEASVPQYEEGAQEMDDEKPLGPPSAAPSASEDDEAPISEPAAAAGGSPMAADNDASEDADQMDVEAMEKEALDSAPRGRGRGRGRARQKRGRPPKDQAARVPAKRKKEKEDEEVCFICFDGGDLVVCDRRGCPKVYHPSCVNRDEAFFRAKGRWNCGWHICSNCQKSAQYMCYTCTFSLCKGCISEPAFVRVRGNKGFCATCMNIVMMIESSEDGNNKTGEIDFDDKSSWMYLFKDYWLDLKGKLSLTLEELTRAKTPSKESNAISRNESSDDIYAANELHGASSDSSSRRVEVSIPSRNKVKAKKRQRNIANEENLVKEAESEATSISGDVGWASNELLEFVAHVKDGDKSALSQFDVQALLLEYIKRNNLRDPRRKSHIICDTRLQYLFGKTHVGHFEMLKLLESHFLTKEPSPVVTDENQGGVVDPDPSQIDTERNSDASTRLSSDKRRRTHKRLQEKEPQTNLDDYAAIDVHNISLMYLRRNLMEDLIDDIDTFSEKVVGTFVRIRISASGQRQDIYRLVQVVGTGKAAKKYRTGKKTTDFTLEILNLNKTEFITIDIISNQEFTEEECKRLRQSIKCGLIARLTVGEVQDKAGVLQAARVNDWMESEKLRLGNLRDRASEKGRRKELRECVEKLQLLSTPEELMRKLNEVPDIHADLKMDPDYESSEDEGEPEYKKQDNFDHSRESFFLRKGSGGTSPGKGGSVTNNDWNSARKSTNTIGESNRDTPTENARDVGSFTCAGNKMNESSFNQEKEVQQTTSSQALNTHSNINSLSASSNNQLVLKHGQSSVVPFENTSASSSTGAAALSNNSEMEKIWRYQDPSGKVQGPFSLTQLRKWNTTGYFPVSLRIWRTSERQEDSILLTDALIGKFQKDSQPLVLQHNIIAQPTKVAAMVDGKGNNYNGGLRGNNTNTWTDDNQNAVKWKVNHNSATTGNNEFVKTDMWASQSSGWSSPKSVVVNQKEDRFGISSGGWQSSNNSNVRSGQSQDLNSSRLITPFSGNPHRSPSYQGRGGRGRWIGGHNRQNSWTSSKPRGLRPVCQGFERHPNLSSSSQQSLGGHWNNQLANTVSTQLRNDSFNLPIQQTCNRGWTEVQGALNNPPPTAPIQPMSLGWGTIPRGNEAEIPPTPVRESSVIAQTTNSAGGWGSSSSANLFTQPVIEDASSSCPAASASMPNTAKIAETADSVQIPAKRDCLDHFQMSNEQKRPSEPYATIIVEAIQLPCRDETVTLNCATGLKGSGSTESRSGSDNNQSIESACSTPNTRCQKDASDVRAPSHLNERQDLPVAGCNELDPEKGRTGADDRPAAENRNVSLDGGVLDPATSTLDPQPKSKLDIAPSDAHQPPMVQHHDVKPMVASISLKSVSAQGSETFSAFKQEPVSAQGSETFSAFKQEPVSAQGSETFSAFKQEPGDSNANPAFARNVWKKPESPKSEPNVLGAVPVESGNLEVLQEKRFSEQRVRSPALTTNPTAWSTSADPTSGNCQNNHPVSPLSSQQPTSVHWNVSSTSEPAQSSNSAMGVFPQNPSAATEPAQTNSNLVLGTGTNAAWGVVTQGNMNVVWGIPAQGNPNLNIGWGTPVQANPSASTGWGNPAQGDGNVNMVWGAPAQGNTNQIAGWVAPAQGNAAPNPTWGAPAQGNSAPNPAWGAPAQGNSNPNPGCEVPTQENVNQNIGWGTPVQANANANAGWGGLTWNPSSSSAQPNQSGDRRSGQHERGFRSSNPGYGGGRHPWNRIQPDGEKGSSRPQWVQDGVCIYHKSGHCKKGANCNFVHR